MSVDEQFQTAAATAKAWTKRPTDAEFLEVYSYYKQAISGDINIEKPGGLDLKGKAKWDAWNSRKGLTKDESKTKYIQVVNEKTPKYA